MTDVQKAQLEADHWAQRLANRDVKTTADWRMYERAMAEYQAAIERQNDSDSAA